MESDNISSKRKRMTFIVAQVQFVSTKGELFSGLTPPEQSKIIFNETFAKKEGFYIKPSRPRGKPLAIYIG